MSEANDPHAALIRARESKKAAQNVRERLEVRSGRGPSPRILFRAESAHLPLTTPLHTPLSPR